MDTVLKDKKVGDMTIGELQDIIRQTLYEFLDPDYGLELRPEVEKDLEESMRQKERGEVIPLEKVKKQLGLE
jgi:ABC-type glutathione transport system ATPase component